MKSILRRLTLIIKIWLRALLAPAENPRQTFEAAHGLQQELLRKVRVAQANITASKRQLEAKTAEAREKLPRLQEQARQALVGGREDLARLALQRRQVTMEELQTLEPQVEEIEQEEGVLSIVEQRLATRIEAFFARQDLLAARYSSAEAQVRIQEALGGISDELAGFGHALERAEHRTENMQARAYALDEMVDLGILDVHGHPMGDAVARIIADDQASEAVEDQLAALKRQAGLR